jgi:dyslexia susceptibility 1 candidate gene 1 protein
VPPRSRAATVPVAFTPTETEHLPAREQREEELRVFKRGAAKGKPDDSVDVADRTPAFLKDKGDALYKQGNFRWAAQALQQGPATGSTH